MCGIKIYKQVNLKVAMERDEPLNCPFKEILVTPAAGVSSADSFQVSAPWWGVEGGRGRGLPQLQRVA